MAPATVLVVDDDPVILKLLEVNFEMEGFSVVRASDGAEGLERAREVLPDIVVLDVMMPRMTGYEVAKALREDDDTAHIPIIFVTARAQSSDVERGMELGVDDYVTKPFDPLDLIARVNILLARARASGAANGEVTSADGGVLGEPAAAIDAPAVAQPGAATEPAAANESPAVDETPAVPESSVHTESAVVIEPAGTAPVPERPVPNSGPPSTRDGDQVEGSGH